MFFTEDKLYRIDTEYEDTDDEYIIKEKYKTVFSNYGTTNITIPKEVLEMECNRY